jgi:hypothetical protein
MKETAGARLRILSLLTLAMLFPLHSQWVNPDDPSGAIKAQLLSVIHLQFGQDYRTAFSVLDSSIKRNESTTDGGELSDPYNTLRGFILFGADRTTSVDLDDQHGIMGMYKDGQIVWHSDPIFKGEWYGIFSTKDINQDGKVDILVEWTPGSQMITVRDLWIISWDGTTGTIINQTNPQNGNTTIHATENTFDLISIDNSAPMLIRGLWPDEEDFHDWFPNEQISTMPYVTYGWNGLQYGLWPGTRQIPADEFLPANLLSVSVKCAVKTLGDSLAFQYYWTNNPASRQCMAKFSLFGVKKSFFPVELAHWDFIGWMRDWPVAGWEVAGLQKLRYSLPPGNDQEGVLIHTQGLPTIVRFYIQGYRPEPDFGSDWSTYKERSQSDFLSNSFVGTTIGPVDPPDTLIPLDFLDTLSTYSTQSRALGWITSQTVADKYLSYFSTAKTQLDQNNTAGARTTLQSVLRDVDVDSSSALTSEAYALLRYNTEYLLDQLPTPQELSIDDLIALKHESESKGWIGDGNFVKELDNGLDNAKKHLARGDSVNCAKELEKFQEKVKKEYDKTVEDQKKHKPRDKRFVTEEGYQSLTEGAQKIIDRIAEKK